MNAWYICPLQARWVQARRHFRPSMAFVLYGTAAAASFLALPGSYLSCASILDVGWRENIKELAIHL